MKKAISLLLAILMIAVGVVPAMATETDEIHEIFSVSDEELFSDTFGVSASTYSVNNVSNSGVIYDYHVVLEDDGTYSASMEFDVVINGTAHHATAFGTLDAIELDNGSIYLSGPLDGTIEVGNNEYKIIVGFQTEYGSDEISAGITLENGEILSFAFGEYELSDELFANIHINNTDEVQIAIKGKTKKDDSIKRATTSNYVYEFMDDGVGRYNNVVVNTVSMYYSEEDDLLAGVSTPDSNALVEASPYSTAKVYRVRLYFKSNHTRAYFDGFHYDPGVNVRSQYGQYVYDLINDVAGVYSSVSQTGLYVPSETLIRAVYNTFTGPVTSVITADANRIYYYQAFPSYQSATTGFETEEIDFVGIVRAECTSEIDNPYSLSVESQLRYICTNGKQTYYLDVSATATDYCNVSA